MREIEEAKRRRRCSRSLPRQFAKPDNAAVGGNALDRTHDAGAIGAQFCVMAFDLVDAVVYCAGHGARGQRRARAQDFRLRIDLQLSFDRAKAVSAHLQS